MKPEWTRTFILLKRSCSKQHRMFRFASPYFILLLLVIPAAILYHRRRRTQPVMGSSSLLAFQDVKTSWVLKSKWILPVLKYGALGLMIVALARPQWGTQQMIVTTEGINIILAVDLSESMAALDFKRQGQIVNRLEAIKGVINDFIATRQGDRIGVVVFGTHAYTQLPLTRDYNTIATIVERLQIGAAGKSTAIGDALGIALKRLEDIPSQSNIIILLTDGRSNSGELAPDIATGIAAQKQVKIYSIGVGSRGRVPFLIKDPVFGERYVYQRVDIDETTLQQAAEQTGGLYFRAENLEGLAQIYETIGRMEKTEVDVQTYAEYNELYAHVLATALVALGVWILLTNTRYLKIP
jgi:Ca-activated chloride channel family protein